jgi:hypothetical protein
MFAQIFLLNENLEKFEKTVLQIHHEAKWDKKEEGEENV